MPGFIESHDHIDLYGSALQFLDVSPLVTPSLKEALHKMKAEGKLDRDGWIYAIGADQTLYTEKRGPTRKELDELFPDRPALIVHLSGHGAFANSKAFEAAGVTKDTPNPQGGEFEKDENGEMTTAQALAPPQIDPREGGTGSSGSAGSRVLPSLALDLLTTPPHLVAHDMWRL